MMMIAVASYVAVASAESLLAEDDPKTLFSDFLKQFDKEYNGLEEPYRFKIFQDSLRLIKEHNAKNLGYTLGITPFADMTTDEFSDYVSEGLKGWNDMDTDESLEQAPEPTAKEIDDLPESVDWVAKGAVSSAKYQGRCGCCWAFSAVGALESAFAIATGDLIELSTQDLLDCDPFDGRCNGGWMGKAFKFVTQEGICGLNSYPYECKNSESSACAESEEHPKCSACNKVIQPGEITRAKIKRKDADAMKAAVAKQPVCVSIATSPTFRLYKEGILPPGQCGDKLNHGVLIVGYGEENGVTYWNVKNSWGKKWGEEGFVRLQRSGDDVPVTGTCGVLRANVYPQFKANRSEEVLVA